LQPVIGSMEEGKGRLAEIFVREKSRFLRFVRRQLYELSSTDAEDILSDVIYSLLRRADVIDQVENLTAYIYRSLGNRIADQRRRRVSTVALDAKDDHFEAGAFEPQDSHPGPHRSLEQSELRSRLLEALGELTPPERVVWIATEIDGRNFRELAEEWEEPIGTLLSRKSRATARLRSMLSEYGSSRRS
jgi:RNA polymerase sigma factor (sigma-70 family)